MTRRHPASSVNRRAASDRARGLGGSGCSGSIVGRGRGARGYALMTAVVGLALFAIAMFAVSAMLASEWRRTQQATRDTQLRQMLLAGAAMTQQALAEDGAAAVGGMTHDVMKPGVTQIKLPLALTQSGATLTRRVLATSEQDSQASQDAPDVGAAAGVEGEVTIVFEATFERARLNQRVTYVRSSDGWTVRAAALDRPAPDVRVNVAVSDDGAR